MLPNHAPLMVAEQFGTLATLFPGRIDLGLGRAPGTDMATARALRRDIEARRQLPAGRRRAAGVLRRPPAGQTVQAISGAAPGCRSGSSARASSARGSRPGSACPTPSPRISRRPISCRRSRCTAEHSGPLEAWPAAPDARLQRLRRGDRPGGPSAAAPPCSKPSPTSGLDRPWSAARPRSTTSRPCSIRRASRWVERALACSVDRIAGDRPPCRSTPSSGATRPDELILTGPESHDHARPPQVVPDRRRGAVRSRRRWAAAPERTLGGCRRAADPHPPQLEFRLSAH